jgi:outer membrane immunogenic protein
MRAQPLGVMMRKMLFAGALLAAAVGQASAADLPRKAPVMKAPIIDTWSWTGFYIGGNAGYSWGRWDSVNVPPSGGLFPGTATTFGTTASPNVDGWLVGGQVGYNWQIDYWVVGFEADWQWTGEKASNTHTITLGPIPVGDSTLRATGTNTNNWSFPWFGTFRGRVGWTTADHWLFYATGGLAYGNAKFSNVGVATVTLTSPGGAVVSNTLNTGFAGSTTRVGWTVGGGIEKAFSRNWSVKAEYLYVDLGTHRFFPNNPGFATDVRLRDHIARIGINYKFDTGPVVARY